MIVQKTKKQPKKSAAFGGRLLVLFWGLKYSHLLEVQDKICTYWVYLMEHIFFRGPSMHKNIDSQRFLRNFGFPARSWLGAQQGYAGMQDGADAAFPGTPGMLLGCAIVPQLGGRARWKWAIWIWISMQFSKSIDFRGLQKIKITDIEYI